MDHGIGFHVAPGIRLRTTRRGPRVSIGPRIVRVELAAGTAAPGDHEVLASRLPAGGPTGRTRGHPSRGRIDAFQGQRAHLDELLRAHERAVVRASPPQVSPAAPASVGKVRRALRHDEMTGIPIWHLAARRRARARADERLAAELERRTEQAAAQRAQDQLVAARWWRGLIDADEPTVLASLDAIFTARDLPAAAVGVTGSTAHVIVTADTPDRLIGRRGPRVTQDDEPDDEQERLAILHPELIRRTTERYRSDQPDQAPWDDTDLLDALVVRFREQLDHAGPPQVRADWSGAAVPSDRKGPDGPT